MKNTKNYGFNLPERGEFYNVEDFNENFEGIDTKLKEFEDGTTPVGNANKLGGKDASEYALSKDFGRNDNYAYMESGNSNELYRLQLQNGNVIVFKSTNGGTSWTELDTVAKTADHNIKTYTTLEQLGLSDADVSANDFLTAVTTIISAMPTKSILFLYVSSGTNVLNVTHNKIKSDLGITTSCSSLEMKIEKYHTNNGLTRIDVFEDATYGRTRVFTCLFDTSSNVPAVSKFAESYNADGFVSGITPYFTSGETILDWASNPNGVYKKFVLSYGNIPSDVPINTEGWYEVKIDDEKLRRKVFFYQYGTTDVYEREIFSGEWRTNWVKSHATTADLAKVDGTETLTTSVLEKALSASIGISNYKLGGSSYPSNSDLPHNNYRYGEATIIKYDNSTITVIAWGRRSGAPTLYPPVFNCYNGTEWGGWQTFATTTDLANYFSKAEKPSGTYTGNGSAESRTIETGGMGDAIIIYGSSPTMGVVTSLVTWGGAICEQGGHVLGVAASGARAISGNIVLATDSFYLNESGVKYTYQTI